MGQENGKLLDELMRGLNILDASLQGAVGYEKFRRAAQGRRLLANQADALSKAYKNKVTPLSLGVEAANAAWLVADPEKRKRAEKDFEDIANKSAVERMVESALSNSDVLYGTGKTIYDTGKAYESVERGKMDEINNSLLRKIRAETRKKAQQEQDVPAVDVNQQRDQKAARKFFK
jgi:hypothetical protein